MPNFDLGRLLDEIMREIFDERKLTNILREKLWKKYFDFFSSAMDVGYSPSFEYYSKELAVNLLANLGEFSAFKARSFEKSLAESLINSKGRVSWSDFKKIGASINADYNKKWLKTEYHQTVAITNMAGKWEDFQRTKDIYPNLKYETVGDDRVRAKHREWDGIVLPIDHPWWKTHYPPNDWGCRCDVIRTDEPVSKHIPSGQLKIEFKNNPAISGKVFNTSVYLTSGGFNPETIESIINWSHKMFKKVMDKAKSEVSKYVKIKKKLPLFKGDIDSFVQKVLTEKRTKNEVFHLANLDKIILKDMGEKSQSKKVMLLDKTITKYIKHPKKAKNATLDFDKFSDIQKALKKPTHIYRQIHKNRILYIYEYQYNNEKSLKVVVEPNFIVSNKYVTINIAKSIGVVNSYNLYKDNNLYKLK